MDNTEIWIAVIRYLAAVGIGIVIGIVFSKGKATVRGKEYTIPYIERTSRNFTLMISLLLAISLIAVMNTAISNNNQAECNREFRRVIAERSAITAQDNDLQNRYDDLSTASFDQLHDLISSLVANPPLPEAEITAKVISVDRALQENLDERGAIKVEQQKLADQRAANPYPDPRCN